jgi:hypothetical protein
MRPRPPKRASPLSLWPLLLRPSLPLLPLLLLLD